MSRFRSEFGRLTLTHETSQIGTMTGRVLSIRDHAIQVPLPVHNSALDHMSLDSRLGLSIPHTIVAEIAYFVRLIELRRLSGLILESVYVRRQSSHPSNPGMFNGQNGIESEHINGHVETSFERICAQAETIGLQLSAWEQSLGTLSPSVNLAGNGRLCDSTADDSLHGQYIRELRIESSLLQLMLYRPSPVFMIPSSQMVQSAGRAAARAIDEWAALAVSRPGGVCTSARQLHGMMLAGLVVLYCDWYTSSDPPIVCPHLLTALDLQAGNTSIERSS